MLRVSKGCGDQSACELANRGMEADDATDVIRSMASTRPNRRRNFRGTVGMALLAAILSGIMALILK